MENNGYGQLRQDMGRSITLGEELKEALEKHAVEDSERFAAVMASMSNMQKIMWVSVGIGIQNLIPLISNYLLK